MDDTLDLVTLSWCLGEIREALTQTESLLERQLQADGDDLSLLRLARASLHQAHGALLMVEVPGVSVLTEEAETLLDGVERDQYPLSADLTNRLAGAFRAVVEHLEDLLQGHPHQPMHLFPYLKALLEARSAERIHPADLFFPDLTRRLPVVVEQRAAPASAADLAEARLGFEKGLLRFLREPDSPRGVEYMLVAVGTVERSERGAPHRNFWRVALAFFDALRSGALQPDVYVKRLLARMNLQLRKTIDEGAPVADRLFKDTLFSLAGMRGGSPVVGEVRRVYELDGMVPADYLTARYGRHDARILRSAREALTQLKVGWDKYMRGGSQTDMVAVGNALDGFRAAVDRLPGTGMRALASALVEVRRRAAADGEPLPDALGLEVATAILCAEQILEQGGRAGEELDPKAGEMAARLRAVAEHPEQASRELPDWLQSLSRKAQERMTMSVFIAESQGNLRAAEKELDAFFRDAAHRDGLPDTLRQLQQVSGALRLLGHADVAEAADAVSGQVAQFIENELPPSPAECERVASSLGAIGFFVEGLQQPERLGGHFEFDRETGEFRARLADPVRSRRGEAAVEATGEGGAEAQVANGQAAAASGSIESALSNHTSAAEGLLASLQQSPDDEALRGQLRDALERVRDDAVLLDDGELKRQAIGAIGLLDGGQAPAIEELSAAIAGIGGAPAAVEPVAPVEAPTDEAAIDTELLEIFLAEADEVLQAIGDSQASSRQAPSDQQFLTTIRRGFHTLKGSSRMVGLTEFGEAGWAMEQVLNQLLADERPGSEPLYALIDAARDVMGDWVTALTADPRARTAAAELVAAANAFREGRPVTMPSRASATGSVAEVEAAAAAVQEIDAEAPAATEQVDADAVAEAGADVDASSDAADRGGHLPDTLLAHVPGLAGIDLELPDLELADRDAAGLDAAAIDVAGSDADAGSVPAGAADLLDPAAPDAGESLFAGDSVFAGDPVFTDTLPLHDPAGAAKPPADEPVIAGLLKSEAAEPLFEAPLLGGEPVVSAATPADQTLTQPTAEAPLFDGEPLFDAPADADAPAAADAAVPGSASPDTIDVAVTLSEFNDDIDAAIARFVSDDASPASADDAPVLDETIAADGNAEAAVPAQQPDAGLPALVEPDSEEPALIESAAQAPVEHFAPAEQSDVVQIGHLTVSRPLYMIFLGEADELIATLVRDCDDWHAHPQRNASEAALRAVHSLAGSASVVGLTGVQAIAEQLETIYQTQAASGHPLDQADMHTLVHAIERTRAMLHRFAGGAVPRDEPETLAAVAALAERLQSDALRELSIPADVSTFAAEQEPLLEVVTDDSPAAVAGDELDADLLPLFVEEADELLPAIGEDLRRWLQSPADTPLAQRLMRAAHTVKGSARMAGAMALGHRLHDMETRIESLAMLAQVPRELIEDLIAEHDQVVTLFDAIKHPPEAALPGAAPAVQADSVAPDAIAIVASDATEADAAAAATGASAGDVSASEAAAGAEDAVADEVPVQDVAAPAVAATGVLASEAAAHDSADRDTPDMPPPRAAADVAPTMPPRPQQAVNAAAPAAQLVRVRAELLDRLVNEAGEVSISRAKLDNELTGLRQSLADLTENVNRLRTQLRELEIQAETTISARIAQTREHERKFDPLEFDRYTRFQELTRMMAESVNDVATVQQNASRNLDEAAQDLLRQGQVLRELQQNLMRVRMVQFGSISDRMFRVVRQAAKDAGKRVNLDLRGAGVEVDRGVLERMAGPIEHLLRNAVAHGIEPAAVRQAAGKPDTGEISVEVRQEGNEIGLTFSDDGGGIDLARIRARAEAAGLVAPGAQLSDRELAELIFSPGFTTADKVTELYGRGVGMDVVRAETVALGGRIETESRPGAGTRFTVRLPLTLAIAQVVLVSAGTLRYAVPSSSVEQVLQFKPQTLAAAYSQGHVEWQGTKVPMFYLGALVDSPDASPAAQHYSPVVIVRSGSQRIALHVDEVTRNQEVVVKNVGPQVAQVRGVSGATVMGNGDIVLIINPVLLAQSAAGSTIDLLSLASGARNATRLQLPTSVMVVDDSLTVRKATQRLLTREGYQVTLAKDGVDALRQLQDGVPDIMLVDIEMPRMDGFDLTRNVRADERYRHVPIVMITSRTADKHRDYALSLGVDAYMGKPYGEDELLSTIAGFLARTRPALAAT